MRRSVLLALLALACGPSAEELQLGQLQQSVGEPTGTYPSYVERAFHYLTNRGRIDPVDADVCGRGFNVPVTKPLEWNYNLNQSARFHSREMALAPCFQHESCGFIIGTELSACSSRLPPEKGGSCTPGVTESWCMTYDPTSQTCTAKCPTDARLATFARFPIFGYTGSTKGENIAAGQTDARAAYCDFFLEGPTPVPDDGQVHGHFENIVSGSFNEVGHGYASLASSNKCTGYTRYFTQDFGGRGGVVQSVMASGSHYKRSGASATTFGVTWNQAAAPASINVVIDGACTALTLQAGKPELGAYEVALTPASGCHKYYFVGTTAGGQELTFPTSGSLTAGIGSACTADFDPARTVGTCGGSSTCKQGDPCASPDGCKTGTLDCSTAQATCVNLVNQADGKSCGTNKTCQNGACTVCTPGAACTSPDGCKVGTASCNNGALTCGNLSDAANGTACGAGKVCNAGACVTCGAGAACDDPGGNPCLKGTISCATGAPVCTNPVAVNNGTGCGTGKYCYRGACQACDQGNDCAGPDVCTAGKIDCASGLPVCANVTLAPDGTGCGNGNICMRGTCGACVVGKDCAVGDGCLVGKLSCSASGGKCQSPVTAADGAACPIGTCQAGVCVAGPKVEPPDAGTAAEPPDAAAPAPEPTPAEPEPGCGCASASGGFESLGGLLGMALLARRRRRA